jgi:predicted metal-dependent phosphoesterase TrpH
LTTLSSVNGLLLCELHAHTTWSDGQLTLHELVDLYGEHGFDVLCITDHSVRLDDPMTSAVDPWTWPAYITEIRAEAERAQDEYGLLVIPGLELTDNCDDPDVSAHALALGLDEHLSVDEGIVAALEAANDLRAAVVAAHPYSASDATSLRPTRRIAREAETFRPLVHRYELFNRDEVFGWVAEQRLSAIASGDVHRAAHIASWKTLLPCEHDEDAVVDYLRSRGRVCLMPYAADLRQALPEAA